MSTRLALAEASLKSVLVPSDFTEASSKPLRHGISIARHVHGRLTAHLPATTTYQVVSEAHCAVLTVRN